MQPGTQYMTMVYYMFSVGGGGGGGSWVNRGSFCANKFKWAPYEGYDWYEGETTFNATLEVYNSL